MHYKVKTIATVLFGMLIGISCKKDSAKNSNSIGNISVNIDGTSTQFDVMAKATRLSVSGGYGISISGYKKDPSTSGTNLTLSVVSPNPIIAQTYTQSANGNPLLQMKYVLDFLTVLYEYEMAANPSPPSTITITEINGTSVKGTFSGIVSGNGINGNPIDIHLTNGQFNVNF